MPNYDKANLLVFPGFPEFRPFYTPIQLLELGVGGGTLLNRVENRAWIPDPQLKQDVCRDNTSLNFDVARNKYGVKPIKMFTEMDTQIQKEHHFLHWYINFFYGKRTPDDRVNIMRWRFVLAKLTPLSRAMFDEANLIMDSANDQYLQTVVQYAWNPKVEFPSLETNTNSDIDI